MWHLHIACSSLIKVEKWDVEVGHLPAFVWAALFLCPVLGRMWSCFVLTNSILFSFLCVWILRRLKLGRQPFIFCSLHRSKCCPHLPSSTTSSTCGICHESGKACWRPAPWQWTRRRCWCTCGSMSVAVSSLTGTWADWNSCLHAHLVGKQFHVKSLVTAYITCL